ncbi:MAG: hypothetical protein Ta2E_09720 [Mycoplasmoidaceae bacterium]|nr:MAG: hypothetical protein Ta2E_09720 [Mycoplasmoidaceae bacterium]
MWVSGGKRNNCKCRAQTLNCESIDQSSEIDIQKKEKMLKHLNKTVGELLDVKILIDGENRWLRNEDNDSYQKWEHDEQGPNRYLLSHKMEIALENLNECKLNRFKI